MRIPFGNKFCNMRITHFYDIINPNDQDIIKKTIIYSMGGNIDKD